MQKLRSGLIQGFDSGTFIGIIVAHKANEAVEINPMALNFFNSFSQMRSLN
jgi:hypothetical protein